MMIMVNGDDDDDNDDDENDDEKGDDELNGWKEKMEAGLTGVDQC